MKLLTTISLLFFILLKTSFAQLNPEPRKVTQKFFPENESIENVTPALQKNRGFTDYEELISFLNTQKQNFPDKVTIEYLGESQRGHNIPILFIQNSKPESEKIKVWLQGGLHGNEPASTEGLLYLIYQLLNNDSYSYLLENIELAIVPMANIDGYLRLDRNAADGLDLNRDQTKLMAPESIILKNAYSTFNPEVALDFHEYNAYRKDFRKMGAFGITSAYDVMFLYSNNLNIPESFRLVIDTFFVEETRKEMDKNNLKHNDYMSTKHHCGEIHFNIGATNARSSATSYALSNAICALIEVRGVHLGRTSFKRRINTTFLVGISYLNTTFKNLSLIKSSIQTSIQTDLDITITTTTKATQDTITVIDLDKNEYLELPITVRNAKNVQANLTRPSPKAYLLKEELSFLVEKLKVLGLEVEVLNEEKTIEVETYTITTYEKDLIKFEKMNLQSVESELTRKTILFPKGTFMVKCNQKNRGLLYEVLEPEAPNGFVGFGVLETNLNDELPIYRIPKTN